MRTTGSNFPFIQKKIKLFKKENEEIKHSLSRQTQIDTTLLLNSKELSDSNAKLQALIDQLTQQIEHNIDSVAIPEHDIRPVTAASVIIQNATVTS